MSTTTGIIKRRERPQLFGAVRVESPFPPESLYQLFLWSRDVWDMLADDTTPTEPGAFVAWQEQVDGAENVLTWGVWRGKELGGHIRFILDPAHPWQGQAHCLFKKDFWGQATTVPAMVAVGRELFEQRGITKLNLHTLRGNHAIGGLLKFLGARLEGEIRRAYVQHGKYVDTCIWGMTPEELTVTLSNPKVADLLRRT